MIFCSMQKSDRDQKSRKKSFIVQTRFVSHLRRIYRSLKNLGPTQEELGESLLSWPHIFVRHSIIKIILNLDKLLPQVGHELFDWTDHHNCLRKHSEILKWWLCMLVS